MEIFLIRHGKAEDFSASGGDAARRLTEKGWTQAEAVGAMLRGMEQVPELVLSSPLARARETAEGIMASAGLTGEPVIVDWLGFGMEATEVMRELGALKAGVNRVALVGHEPSCSGFVERVMASQDGYVDFKKASVAWFSANPPSMRGMVLRMLVPPKALQAVK
ncbi:MAG: histidine phosphatase family protein [Verrucomicrobiota bacterium]